MGCRHSQSVSRAYPIMLKPAVSNRNLATHEENLDVTAIPGKSVSIALFQVKLI